jgi:hypothetical protein
VNTDAMKEQLKKDEAALMGKMTQSLANRDHMKKLVHEAGDGMRASREKLGEELESLREQLRPYLDGRKKLDGAGVKLAYRYQRMIKDERHLTTGPDLCNEIEAGADLHEIGPESDGASSYRNMT